MESWVFLLLFSCAISLIEICRKLNDIRDILRFPNEEYAMLLRRANDELETIRNRLK